MFVKCVRQVIPVLCLTGEGESGGDGDLRQRSKCQHE